MMMSHYYYQFVWTLDTFVVLDSMDAFGAYDDYKHQNLEDTFHLTDNNKSWNKLESLDLHKQPLNYMLIEIVLD